MRKPELTTEDRQALIQQVQLESRRVSALWKQIQEVAAEAEISTEEKKMRTRLEAIIVLMEEKENPKILRDAQYHNAKFQIMTVLAFFESRMKDFRASYEALSHVLEVCHDNFSAYYTHIQAIECILRYPDLNAQDFEMLNFHLAEMVHHIREMPEAHLPVISELAGRGGPFSADFIGKVLHTGNRDTSRSTRPSAPSPSPAGPSTPTGPQES